MENSSFLAQMTLSRVDFSWHKWFCWWFLQPEVGQNCGKAERNGSAKKPQERLNCERVFFGECKKGNGCLWILPTKPFLAGGNLASIPRQTLQSVGMCYGFANLFSPFKPCQTETGKNMVQAASICYAVFFVKGKNLKVLERWIKDSS